MTEAAAAAREVRDVFARFCRCPDDHPVTEWIDEELAALDAANMTIVAKGMVCLSVEDARDTCRVVTVSDHQWTGRVRKMLNDAIARAGSGPGEGEALD